MIAFVVPPLTIEIADGDIAAEATDAVVNAANTELWMGSGVAGALKARGGSTIEAEAMAQGPIRRGESISTSGGTLAAAFVIHTAVMGPDLRTSAELIDLGTRSALALAETDGMKSIAFPALGTGVGGFALDQCARVMIEAIRAHAHDATSLRLVRLILFGQRPYRVFATVAGELLGPPLDGPPDCAVSG